MRTCVSKAYWKLWAKRAHHVFFCFFLQSSKFDQNFVCGLNSIKFYQSLQCESGTVDKQNVQYCVLGLRGTGRQKAHTKHPFLAGVK